MVSNACKIRRVQHKLNQSLPPSSPVSSKHTPLLSFLPLAMCLLFCIQCSLWGLLQSFIPWLYAAPVGWGLRRPYVAGIRYARGNWLLGERSTGERFLKWQAISKAAAYRKFPITLYLQGIKPQLKVCPPSARLRCHHVYKTENRTLCLDFNLNFP